MPAIKQETVRRFSVKCGKLVDAFAKKLESQQPPPIIYHYTDDRGLRGILESGAIHLHDIFGLNDPSELSYGFSISAGILIDKARTYPGEIRKFAERYANFGLQRGIEASAHFFSCSFSGCGDDLGQWRAYADNGHGFAIGFETKILEAAFTTEGGQRVENNCTFPVSYKAERLRKMYEKWPTGHLTSCPDCTDENQAIMQKNMRTSLMPPLPCKHCMPPSTSNTRHTKTNQNIGFCRYIEATSRRQKSPGSRDHTR